MTRHEIHGKPAVALDTLRARKVRSALTILGIVIGVTSVIAVAAIIDGLNGVIKERVAQLGSRTFSSRAFRPNTGPGRLPQKIRMRKYLQDDDAAFIEETCPGRGIRHGLRATASISAPGGRQHPLRRRARGALLPARRAAGIHRRLAAVRDRRGALHLAIRRGARAQRGGDRPGHRRIRCFRTSTRSARWCA